MAIQSVHRALDILCLFATSRPSLSLTQIANALDLNKNTTFGLISSLVQTGFLWKNPHTKQYRLGSKVYELGLVFSSSLEINRIAAGPAQVLAEKTQQTPRIAILEGDFALVTLFALPGAQTSLATQVGPRLPLYCTAIGRALLAFGDPGLLESYLLRTELVKHTEITNTDPEKLRAELKEVVQRGFAIGKGEFVKGQGGIAVPIRGYENKLEGALAISGRGKDILGENMNRYVEELLSTAAAISRNMGCSTLG
jgi:DNA-binding IclR family transcriptional regulator